jgi:hypothetical protein
MSLIRGDSGGGGAGALTITHVNVAASPYTVVAGDQLIVVDSTGGAVIILLPTVATSGREVYVKATAGGINPVTITAFGTNQIDGVVTLVQSVTMVSNTLVSDTTVGTGGWHVI